MYRRIFIGVVGVGISLFFDYVYLAMTAFACWGKCSAESLTLVYMIALAAPITALVSAIAVFYENKPLVKACRNITTAIIVIVVLQAIYGILFA